MMNNTTLAIALDIYLAATQRAAKQAKEKFGDAAAVPYSNVIKDIQETQTALRGMPPHTPLEEWIDAQKKKGGR